MHITDSVTAIFAVVAFCAARKQASEAENFELYFTEPSFQTKGWQHGTRSRGHRGCFLCFYFPLQGE